MKMETQHTRACKIHGKSKKEVDSYECLHKKPERPQIKKSNVTSQGLRKTRIKQT
jgi:hypothetical protein